MTPQTLVLFDIDGTLLHASGSGRMATERAMLDVFGTTGGLATYHFMGKTDWFTLRHLLVPEGFSEQEIEEALPRYCDSLARHMSDLIGNFAIYALPGARELVSALRARPDVLLGIITGNMLEVANIKLRAAGFDPDEFAIAAYGSDAPLRRQLASIAVQRAEQHCRKHFASRDITVVGDTPDDVDCAHSIGARAIAVATGFNSRAELEQHQPTILLDSLADLEEALRAVLGERR